MRSARLRFARPMFSSRERGRPRPLRSSPQPIRETSAPTTTAGERGGDFSPRFAHAGTKVSATFSPERSFPKKFWALAAAGLALVLTASARADLRWAASTRAGWAENVSRSSSPLNWKDSATLENSLDATYPRAFARDWLLLASARGETFTVRDFALNNTLALGPRLDLQRKFGFGPYAPTLRAHTSLSYRDARLLGSTGWTTAAGLNFSKRLSPALRASASYDWNQHAAGAATFDVRHRTATARVVWDFTDRWQISASFARLTGHLVAEASYAVFRRALAGDFGALVAESYNARPFLITDSYGPRWYSYRIDARADTSAISLAYALGDRTTVDLRFSGSRVVNEALVRYKTDTSSLGLTHRF